MDTGVFGPGEHINSLRILTETADIYIFCPLIKTCINHIKKVHKILLKKYKNLTNRWFVVFYMTCTAQIYWFFIVHNFNFTCLNISPIKINFTFKMSSTG
jgi:hypothetical protein